MQERACCDNNGCLNPGNDALFINRIESAIAEYLRHSDYSQVDVKVAVYDGKWDDFGGVHCYYNSGKLQSNITFRR